VETLEVRLDWGETSRPVGTLAQKGVRVYFEFDRAFLDSPLPLSPFKLPARPGLFEFEDRDFAEIFGLFNDSLPDGWGLLLMDRAFRAAGLQPARVSVLDRLAYLSTRGMGALTYHPPSASGDDGTLALDLDALARQSARILEGSQEEVLPALRIAGGSPAGARPKVLVGLRDNGQMIAGTGVLPSDARAFLIKFPALGDAPHIGTIELAYARMAAAAGIQVPETQLFVTPEGGRFFGAERFDRRGSRRIHMHTLGGLLHASHRLPSLDYEGFLRATRLLTKDHQQVEEAFRRMAFNVFTHNRDDHVKNHAYLMSRDGGWHLAPAYDLVFSEGPRGEHTMAVGGEAMHPGERDLLGVARAADLDPDRAREILEEVRSVVVRWPEFADAVEVPRAASHEIGEVIRELAARG
jgi:serine/threonine-protein kinase HipA